MHADGEHPRKGALLRICFVRFLKTTLARPLLNTAGRGIDPPTLKAGVKINNRLVALRNALKWHSLAICEVRA
jgi:hypothetical protein